MAEKRDRFSDYFSKKPQRPVAQIPQDDEVAEDSEDLQPELQLQSVIYGSESDLGQLSERDLQTRVDNLIKDTKKIKEHERQLEVQGEAHPPEKMIEKEEAFRHLLKQQLTYADRLLDTRLGRSQGSRLKVQREWLLGLSRASSVRCGRQDTQDINNIDKGIEAESNEIVENDVLSPQQPDHGEASTEDDLEEDQVEEVEEGVAADLEDEAGEDSGDGYREVHTEGLPSGQDVDLVGGMEEEEYRNPLGLRPSTTEAPVSQELNTRADGTSSAPPARPRVMETSPTPARFLLSEEVAGNAIRILGCGQCGSQIASTFVSGKPDYVPTMREEFYPVKAVAFDTHEAIVNILTEQWGWKDRDNIFVLPMPSPQYLAAMVLGTENADAQRQIGSALLSRQAAAGVGGVPFLGRLAAESTLLGEGSLIEASHFGLRDTIRDTLQTAGFVSGLLVTCNSLTGGTGTGFSPIATRFMLEKVGFRAPLTLNVSVLPGQQEVGESSYPRNILASLHYMLTTQLEEAGIVDSVIVADNDALARISGKGRTNYRVFNEVIRNMLTPFLLAPQGRYTVPELGSNLDEADIKRWIKKERGFGLPQISALGYGTMPLNSFMPGRFQSAKSRKQKLTDALRQLVKIATSNYSLGDEAHPEVGGVGLLFGPPEFFERALEMDSENTHSLTSFVRETIENNQFRTLDCLKFETEGLDQVGLALLVAGVSSRRLTDICEQALGTGRFIEVWDNQSSLTDNIRNLPEHMVEELMINEIRQALEG